MKILLIGGTSLIGPHVIHELYSSIPSVKIITLTRSGRNYFCETPYSGDRNDESELERILRDEDPDILIDMIAFTKESADLTERIIYKINPKLPVIVISSIDVYAAYAKIHGTESIGYQDCPLKETDKLRTLPGVEGLLYDKLGVEKPYTNRLPNVTVLRLPAIYGWPDTTRVDTYLDQMLDGQSQIVLSKERAEWKFSRCLHKNAAHAIVTVVKSSRKGVDVYNVAEEITYNDLDWCTKISKICGWNGEIVISKDTDENVDFKQNFYVSSEKIRRELGYKEKYSPDEGLFETIRFHAYLRQKREYKKYY